MRLEEFNITEAQSNKLVHGTTRGVFNEILLALAVGAKFFRGQAPVEQKHVEKLMAQLRKSPNRRITGRNPEGDPIEIVIGDTGETLGKDIQEPENLQRMAGQLKGDIMFANSDEVSVKLAKKYATNGKPDKVVVKQMGGERSKTDVALIYVQPDGSEKRLHGISAKTYSPRLDNKDVNTLATAKQYFNNLGVNLDVTKYKEFDRTKSATKEFSSMFKQAESQLKTQLAGDNDSQERVFVNNMIDFVKSAMTGGDELILVDVEDGAFSTLKFDLLLKNLQNVDLDVTLKKQTATSQQPELYVYDKNLGVKQGLLMVVRYNMIAPKSHRPGRHRLFIEGGSLFKNLATYMKKQASDQD